MSDFLTRVRHSIRRQNFWGETDRERMKLVTSDLILHLHPRMIPAAALSLTYTFGLGGLAVLLLIIMVATGILLMFAYTPSTDTAYTSLITLQNEVWFGQLIRNLHHWSANLLLIVAGLHLLRVLYTGAFRAPREFNWQIGLFLLGLVIAANFTGYLLPWDQLGYWAVTVATSLIDHIPLIGSDLRVWLLGGEEVNATTLHHFYVLHVMLIPLGFLVAASFHIWRVRKDGFSKTSTEKLTTIPHLISRELIYGLIALALLLAWATWVNAPLGAAADPNMPPNPTKTAWYFMGLQELLLHVHPTLGAVVIPGVMIAALMLLPYLRDESDTVGIWFRDRQTRWLCALSFALGIGITAGVILADSLLPVLLLLPYGWRLYRAEGRRLALFTLILAAFIMLTVIGIFWRGAGMELTFP